MEYDNIVDKLKVTKCLDEANNVGFMERVFGQYLGYELPELATTEDILTWLAGEKSENKNLIEYINYMTK